MSFGFGEQVSLYGSKGWFVHGGHPWAVHVAGKEVNWSERQSLLAPSHAHHQANESHQ